MHKKRADEIQGEADHKLELKLVELFRNNGLEYKQHSSDQKKDKGIDYYCHVYDRTDHSQKIFFQLQNKGTDKKAKRVRKSNLEKISFQLELRHIRQYYSEVTEPVLVVLYEIPTDTAYWYAIQLDEDIFERYQSADTRTLQIYIPCSNTIEQANFGRLLKDIEHSGEVQRVKKNSAHTTEADYSFIKKQTEGLTIIDQAMYTLDLFEDMSVLPRNVISKLHPFIGSNRSFIHNDILRTDNEGLFDYIDSISLKNEKFRRAGSNCNAGETKKIGRLMNFFFHNNIEHIGWAGKSPKKNNRICVHNLILSDGCNCERCSYYRLDFARAANIITEAKGQSLPDKLRSGYAAYLLGDYHKSINLFKEVYKLSQIEGKIVLRLISSYNLDQLKRILELSYFQKGRDALLKELNDRPIRTYEADIKIHYPHLLDIYRWISDNRFINSASSNITSKFEEIDKVHFNDAYGNRHSSGYVQDLIHDFLQLYGFLEYNLIVYQDYYEFKSVAARFFEGLIAMHTLKNKASKRFAAFTWPLLKIWIFHLEYEKALFLLSKYSVKNIPVSDREEVYRQLLVMLENLLNSGYLAGQDKESSIHSKSGAILNTLILLIAKIDFEHQQYNRLLEPVVRLLSKTEARRDSYSAIYQLARNHEQIAPEHLKGLIYCLKKSDDTYTSAFSFCIKRFCEQGGTLQIESLILGLLEIDSFTEDSIAGKEDLFLSLGYAVSFLEPSQREKISALYTNRLQENFNPENYYSAAVFDIIDYNPSLLKCFASMVQDQTKKDPDHVRLLGNDENYRLGQLINLMYKYDQDFADIRHLSSYTLRKDYYDWLMGLDIYDYSDFDCYWILEYQTKFYFKAFKKSKVLKKAIRKSLKKNYIEGVAKIYFDIF